MSRKLAEKKQTFYVDHNQCNYNEIHSLMHDTNNRYHPWTESNQLRFQKRIRCIGPFLQCEKSINFNTFTA